MIKGMAFILEIAGREIWITAQGFAVLSLVFIWLYNGKQGLYNKAIKNMYYAFYPAHMLILSLLTMVV